MQTPANIIFKLGDTTLTCEKGKPIEPGLEQLMKAILWTIKLRTSPHVSATITVIQRVDDYEITAVYIANKTRKQTIKTKTLSFNNISKAASSYDRKQNNTTSNESMNNDDLSTTNDKLTNEIPINNSEPTQLVEPLMNLTVNTSKQRVRNRKTSDDKVSRTKQANKGKKQRNNTEVVIQQVPVIVKEEVIKEVVKEVKVVEEIIKEVIKEVKVGTDCPICFDRTIDCSLDPCGHVFCLTCANQFRLTNRNTCPNCRVSIKQIKRIYY
ncbi:RING finger type zinc finger protein [uncultured virus]|nr:RING finger type zinc finger protein [uncultured virus]